MNQTKVMPGQQLQGNTASLVFSYQIPSKKKHLYVIRTSMLEAPATSNEALRICEHGVPKKTSPNLLVAPSECAGLSARRAAHKPAAQDPHLGGVRHGLK